ncbi:hypothetical protein ACHAXA_003445 [Cyclostephanos tholiformis]|uniref:Uncharacterized protein n=1 Tax=Cyclostephanos tholiformis TaxID=382380 RepID=A0ABD3SG69_9STRA
MTGAIPFDMPDPLGNDTDDSDHAEEKRTKYFHNGSSLFCNRTLIVWVTVEGTKLRMMGIPLSGPSYTSGDNKSHVTDLTKPET